MKIPASTSELATTVSTLASLVLDPSWLSQLYGVLLDSSNREMAKLVAFAQGSDPMYSI